MSYYYYLPIVIISKDKNGSTFKLVDSFATLAYKEYIWKTDSNAIVYDEPNSLLAMKLISTANSKTGGKEFAVLKFVHQTWQYSKKDKKTSLCGELVLPFEILVFDKDI